jgi:2-polyprenyl-3-methyl-5-hydroxy-6-metoxy-1,4-benzoquinol methylase
MDKPYSRWLSTDDMKSREYTCIMDQIKRIYRETGRQAIDPKNEHYENGIYWSREWEYPWAIHSSKVRRGYTILDVGCGKSPFLTYLGMMGCEAYGLDKGETKEHDGLWGYDEDFGKPYVKEIREEMMSEMSYPDNFFDIVFCISVLEHVSRAEVKAGLKEMRRVLKPGGLLVITLDEGIHRELVWQEAGIPFHRGTDFTTREPVRPHSVLGMVFVNVTM